MNRHGLAIVLSAFAGIASVYLLPPQWLKPLSILGVVGVGIFGVIVNLDTKTKPNNNPAIRILLSVTNLPEQPCAEIKEGWALTIFFASAAFLLSIGLTVMWLASA